MREFRGITAYNINLPPLSLISTLKQKTDDRISDAATLPTEASISRSSKSVHILFRFIRDNIHCVPEDLTVYGQLNAREVLMEEKSNLGNIFKRLKDDRRKTNPTESYAVYEALNLVKTHLSPYTPKKLTI